MSNDPIRLNTEDLHSEKVDSYLKLREEAAQMLQSSEQQSTLQRIVYSSWFYLGIACALGALVAWGMLEPIFNDNTENPYGFFLFPTVGACIGCFLGAAEGVMCRNPMRALLSGTVGLGIGFVGGCIAVFIAGIVFVISGLIALNFWDNPEMGTMPTGIALMILMMGRSIAWAIASIPMGIGQGIALREKAVFFNGLIGATLGGLLGGLLFDPISFVFITADGQAAASRAIGFVVIGISIGVFVGLVENWTKSSWLLMRSGPLAGKQFILHREITILGSSPKAQIYLFKDPDIEPQHATINRRGGNCEIVDAGTPAGTMVNGVKIHRQHLRSGDRITMGKTELEFVIREETNA